MLEIFLDLLTWFMVFDPSKIIQRSRGMVKDLQEWSDFAAIEQKGVLFPHLIIPAAINFWRTNRIPNFYIQANMMLASFPYSYLLYVIMEQS